MTSRSLLATKLFAFLEREEIPYIVVGDTRGYPHNISSDIDIVVELKILPEIQKVLFRFCTECNAQIVQVIQHEQTSCYFVCVLTDEKGKLHFLHPDICANYFRRGRLLLRAEDILARRERTNGKESDSPGFFIPAPCNRFLYYLLKKIDKGDLNHRHGEYLSSEWKKETAEALRHIKRFWPEEDAALLASSAEKNEWKTVQAELPRLQKALDVTLSFSFRHWWFELARKVMRVIQPTGVLVVFLGSDGSGKTTVLSQVEHDLAPAFRRTKQYHLRPFFGQSCGYTAPTKNPHDQVYRGFLSSFLKLLLWWADFTVGYAVDVFPRLACSTLVLFDRYYYDLLIDPKRYRYGGPRWLAWLIGKFIPRPDVVIFLDAPAEVLIARKQEISLCELASQRIAYRKLVGKMENGYVVDASKPLNEVGTEVDRIILDFMRTRTAQRLGIRKLNT